MYIHEIKISKFRHIENVNIGPLKSNSRYSETFIFAGPNGGGKSSILELIGYALSNSYSLSWSLSRSLRGFSFEIAFGLIPQEVEEIIKNSNEEISKLKNNFEEQKLNIESFQIPSLTQNFNLNISSLEKIIDYLNKNSIYYRSFKYLNGEYEKNKEIFDLIHDRTSKTLVKKLERPLGFFLKADRSYPQKGFERNKIFEFSNTLKYEHLNTIAFNNSEIQYQDMYDFLVQQRYQFLRNLGSYYNKLNKGETSINIPEDPLEKYEKLLQKLFPEYSFTDKEEDVPSNLFIKLPSGEVISFNDLSSGEKEVFFILSFFIRHNVENAIIMIDEPELHLHPQLARLLIRNMQQIKKGNQIWLATHNSEIIDEAGRDKVLYISKDIETQKAKIVLGKDEEKAALELKNFFGYSGYIGIANNLVFLEGANSSADRKFFTNLLSTSSNIKFIPSNSSNNIHGINAAILSILESNLGLMNYYLIRDRDYCTDEMVERFTSHKSGKIFVIKRHEIENYLLVPAILSKVLDEIFDIKKTSEEIKSLLHKCAIDISASVLRDMISFRSNILLKAEDFSMGKYLNNNSLFNNSDLKVNEEIRTLLNDKFVETSNKKFEDIKISFSKDNILKIVDLCTKEIELAINSDEWLCLFPGKELLHKLCKELKISNSISLQNNIIKELSSCQELISPELMGIIDKIK